MSPKQTDETKKQCIQELRDKISADTDDSFIKSDGYLLNWLEEKKYKVDKAEKAIKLSLQWRKDNKIDTILSENFDESWLPSKYEFIGNDKAGRPVILSYSKFEEVTEQMMAEAMEKALKEKDNSVRYGYFMAEKVGQAIRDAAKITSNPVGSVTVLGDMKSVKFTDYTKYVTKVLPLVRDTMKTFEDNYPGICHELIIVNAPKKAIRLLLTMLRPVIRSDLLDKVTVYGRKPEKWKPILLEKIDANVLPQRYGGTRDDIVQSANL